MRRITHLEDSWAIANLVQFMDDSSEDTFIQVKLSDKKIVIKDFSQCSSVFVPEIIQDVESSVLSILHFYPDDDVPFSEAMADLENYLDGRTYYKCSYSSKAKRSLSKSFYYTDLSDTIHLRLDTISLF